MTEETNLPEVTPEESPEMTSEAPPEMVSEVPLEMTSKTPPEMVEEPTEGKGERKRKREKVKKEPRKRLKISPFSFKNLKIGTKLVFGFGAMVVLVLILVAVTYLNGSAVAANLTRTRDLRVPTSAASKNAKAAMLEMLTNIRGYLSLGEQQFLDGFDAARLDYEANLAELKTFSADWTNPENITRLEQLNELFSEWGVHGGAISVVSEDGKGSTFTVQIPLESQISPEVVVTDLTNGSAP